MKLLLSIGALVLASARTQTAKEAHVTFAIARNDKFDMPETNFITHSLKESYNDIHNAAHSSIIAIEKEAETVMPAPNGDPSLVVRDFFYILKMLEDDTSDFEKSPGLIDWETVFCHRLRQGSFELLNSAIGCEIEYTERVLETSTEDIVSLPHSRGDNVMAITFAFGSDIDRPLTDAESIFAINAMNTAYNMVVDTATPLADGFVIDHQETIPAPGNGLKQSTTPNLGYRRWPYRTGLILRWDLMVFVTQECSIFCNADNNDRSHYHNRDDDYYRLEGMHMNDEDHEKKMRILGYWAEIICWLVKVGPFEVFASAEDCQLQLESGIPNNLAIGTNATSEESHKPSSVNVQEDKNNQVEKNELQTREMKLSFEIHDGRTFNEVENNFVGYACKSAFNELNHPEYIDNVKVEFQSSHALHTDRNLRHSTEEKFTVDWWAYVKFDGNAAEGSIGSWETRVCDKLRGGSIDMFSEATNCKILFLDGHAKKTTAKATSTQQA